MSLPRIIPFVTRRICRHQPASSPLHTQLLIRQLHRSTRTYASEPPSQPSTSSKSSNLNSGADARLPTSRVKLRNRLGVTLPLSQSRHASSFRVLEIPFRQALLRGVVFVLVGAGLVLYLREERARVERKKIANATKGIGKPKVGGPFALVDQDGRDFTDAELKDKYALMYFGYTRCPDICPDELDKMSEVIDMVKASVGDILMPVMVSCDPLRDPPDVLKKYLEDFHPDIVGLTGTHEEIKRTCKEYRVYFSTPPEMKPGEDYLVDHSIYFFLMDPEGDFVEVLGRNYNSKEAAKVIIDHVKDWDGFLDESPRRRGWGTSVKDTTKGKEVVAK